MTLNRVMAVILRYFTEFGSFGSNCVKVIEVLGPYRLQQKFSPKNVVFGSMTYSERLLRKSALKRGTPT